MDPTLRVLAAESRQVIHDPPPFKDKLRRDPSRHCARIKPRRTMERNYSGPRPTAGVLWKPISRPARQDSNSEQIKIRATVHLPFDQLDAVHVPFGSSIVPRQFDRRLD